MGECGLACVFCEWDSVWWSKVQSESGILCEGVRGRLCFVCGRVRVSVFVFCVVNCVGDVKGKFLLCVWFSVWGSEGSECVCIVWYSVWGSEL